jgi:hypothetical protein
VGQWLNGDKNGFGKDTYARDDIDGEDYYIGEFEENLRHGNGKLTWRNGTTYDGEWQEGSRHGFGTLLAKDGNIIYQGQWENNAQKISEMFN